jgi:hypothetical protein
MAGPHSHGEFVRALRVSRSRVSGSVMDELFAARARACGAQRIPGLYGSLLYSSGWFVLWLEGPADVVDSVLKRSAGHACHFGARIIHRSAGPRTLDEPLTLTTTQGRESVAAFGRRIEAVANAATALEPVEMWRLLSEPCTISADPVAEPSSRIALIASDDNRSIDVVRGLADRCGRPMVYQRFASSELHTSDVGAAYVDILLGGEPTRVRVVSRRSLGHRMVQQSLQGVQRLALLLGARPSSAIGLAAGVAGLLNAAALSPEIELVGQCRDTARGVGDYLGEVGRAVPSRVLDLPEMRWVDFLLESCAVA